MILIIYVASVVLIHMIDPECMFEDALTGTFIFFCYFCPNEIQIIQICIITTFPTVTQTYYVQTSYPCQKWDRFNKAKTRSSLTRTFGRILVNRNMRARSPFTVKSAPSVASKFSFKNSKAYCSIHRGSCLT